MSAFDYSLVADIYDQYVKTDLDVSFFREESLKAHGRVLELMCGTGRLSLPLLEAGVRVTCVDNSHDMLCMLRAKLSERGYNTLVVEQDVAHLILSDSYKLALIPFNSFSEIVEVSEQREALSSIHQCLEPGGRLILTLHNPNIRMKRIDGLNHVIGQFPLDGQNASLTLSACEQYDPANNIVTGEQLFEAKDANSAMLWRRNVPIAFRLITRTQLNKIAWETGFQVETFYGNYDRSQFDENTSPFMIWILKTSPRA